MHFVDRDCQHTIRNLTSLTKWGHCEWFTFTSASVNVECKGICISSVSCWFYHILYIFAFLCVCKCDREPFDGILVLLCCVNAESDKNCYFLMLLFLHIFIYTRNACQICMNICKGASVHSRLGLIIILLKWLIKIVFEDDMACVHSSVSDIMLRLVPIGTFLSFSQTRAYMWTLAYFLPNPLALYNMLNYSQGN